MWLPPRAVNDQAMSWVPVADGSPLPRRASCPAQPLPASLSLLPVPCPLLPLGGHCGCGQGSACAPPLPVSLDGCRARDGVLMRGGGASHYPRCAQPARSPGGSEYSPAQICKLSHDAMRFFCSPFPTSSAPVSVSVSYVSPKTALFHYGPGKPEGGAPLPWAKARLFPQPRAEGCFPPAPAKQHDTYPVTRYSKLLGAKWTLFRAPSLFPIRSEVASV